MKLHFATSLFAVAFVGATFFTVPKVSALDAPVHTVELVNPDEIVLPDGEPLAVNGSDWEDYYSANHAGIDDGIKNLDDNCGRHLDFVLDEEPEGSLEETAVEPSIETSLNVRRSLKFKGYAALITFLTGDLPVIVQKFVKWFGKPGKREDLVCKSHRKEDLQAMVNAASFCDSGKTGRYIPSCIAQGTCTSLQDGGLAQVAVGYHYADNKKKEREESRRRWARDVTAKQVADKVQLHYGVDTVYVYHWDTYTSEKKGFFRETFNYDYGYGGEAHVYFYCGIMEYLPNKYTAGLFRLRKRFRECATLVQPFAFSVYNAGKPIDKVNGVEGNPPKPSDINDF